MVDFDKAKVEADLERVKTELRQRNYSHTQLIDLASHYVVLFNNSDHVIKEVKKLNIEINQLRAEKDIKVDGNHKDLVKALSDLKDLKAEMSFRDGLKNGFFLGKKTQSTSLAKKGGNAKKSIYQPLQELAKKMVNEKNWKSRRNATLTIKSAILNESKKLNIPLSESEAEITIGGWLKKMGLPANISS